jgi:hypothetical protein
MTISWVFRIRNEIGHSGKLGISVAVLRATRPDVCPPELISWLAVKEAANREEKTKRTSKRAAWTKIRLRLPDLDQAKEAVLSSLRSPESQRGYEHSINEFIVWYCSEPRLSINKAVVTRYRMHLESRQLAPGTINVMLP